MIFLSRWNPRALDKLPGRSGERFFCVKDFKMKTLLIIAFLLIGLAWFVGATYHSAHRADGTTDRQYTAPYRNSQDVTLHAAPGQSVVQMFNSLGSGSQTVTHAFPTGTKCVKVDGPFPYKEAGIAMNFYRIQCGNVMGYVNTKWID